MSATQNQAGKNPWTGEDQYWWISVLGVCCARKSMPDGSQRQKTRADRSPPWWV